jgi:hypothetical protein
MALIIAFMFRHGWRAYPDIGKPWRPHPWNIYMRIRFIDHISPMRHPSISPGIEFIRLKEEALKWSKRGTTVVKIETAKS